MGIKNSPYLTGITGMINLRQKICMEVLKRKLFAHKLYNVLLLFVHLFIYSSIHWDLSKHSLSVLC